jgi:hypothetical protein
MKQRAGSFAATLVPGFLTVAAVLALGGVAATAMPQEPRFSSSRISGQQYAIGCMNSSVCVTSGIGRGQGLPTAIKVLRGRKVIQFRLLKSAGPGNVVGISCEGSRECIVAAPSFSAGKTVLATVDDAGAIKTRTLVGPDRASFDSISCTGIHSCELVGLNAGGEVVLGSWNGTRVTSARVVALPVDSGIGNYVPEISCSGAWCEVWIDLQQFSPQGDPGDQVGYLVTTHNRKPVDARWISGYGIVSVSCSAGSVCYSILENFSIVGFSGGSFLAAINRGKVGPREPLNVAASGLACRGSTCTIVGSDTVATYVSDRRRALRTIASVKNFFSVTQRPGGSFAAVGAARSSGSIVTLG